MMSLPPTTTQQIRETQKGIRAISVASVVGVLLYVMGVFMTLLRPIDSIPQQAGYSSYVNAHLEAQEANIYEPF